MKLICKVAILAASRNASYRNDTGSQTGSKTHTNCTHRQFWFSLHCFWLCNWSNAGIDLNIWETSSEHFLLQQGLTDHYCYLSPWRTSLSKTSSLMLKAWYCTFGIIKISTVAVRVYKRCDTAKCDGIFHWPDFWWRISFTLAVWADQKCIRAFNL